jgi:hypothetical protein
MSAWVAGDPVVACNNRMTVGKKCVWIAKNSSDLVDREKSGPLEWNKNKEGSMENQQICWPSMRTASTFVVVFDGS